MIGNVFVDRSACYPVHYSKTVAKASTRHRDFQLVPLPKHPNAHNAEEITEVATTYFWVHFIVQY
jgi:hypothetical protein